MKTFVTTFLILCCISAFAQQKKFLIEGIVVDAKGNPITDVYIVNLNSHDKDISHSNGIFAVWVSPTDSLILSHISFFRKIVKVQTLLINPTITLVSENVDIPEILVSPEQSSDMDRAQKNLVFLNEYKTPGYAKIEDNNEPVMSTMTEHNRVLRTEASSISLARFSPSDQVERLFIQLKRKNSTSDYYSTKKQKEEEVEKKD